jgi:hypothetical protein
MVFEKPVIDKRELMRALDPIHGRGEREYERLRKADLLSVGVTANQNQASSARHGLTLFCSLNRDAVSAVRRGHPETASEIRQHAERIERETIEPWLRGALDRDLGPGRGVVELPDEGTRQQDWIDRVLFVAKRNGDPEVPEPVWNAAREVAEIRDRYQDGDAHVRLTVGRVWNIDDAITEVRPELLPSGEAFAFFTDEVLAAGLRLGDPVVVRHEELSPGIFLTTFERGLERTSRVSRVSGQPLPRHLDELLDSSELTARTSTTMPLRHLA